MSQQAEGKASTAAARAKAQEIDWGNVRSHSLWGDALRKMLRNRLAIFGLVITIALLFAAIFGPVLAPYSYTEQDLMRTAELPSAQHWLGTDELGRDLFSRILFGARTATIVAFLSTGLSLFVGLIVGVLAGYGGRMVDSLIGRLIDIIMSVPRLLMAALIAATLKDPIISWANRVYEQSGMALFADTTWLDLVIVFGGLSFVSWPGYARLIRGQILSLREQDFILAARSVGVPTSRIMLAHLLPNGLGPVIVSVTFSLSGAMVLESSLSYLGIGVMPPQASWGNMISANIGSWSYRPWLVAVPSIVLAVVTLGFNFLGDGINDALNPQSSRAI
ncbi:MAG: ABC transporter permease [Anaerolineae bacterium]|nr:ABC transporter permease [Anaerolineae bacterium]